MATSGTQRAKKPREETARRREDILRAAMSTFGTRGYKNGSLAEIADQVGMTHAGVLHHFGSKDQLLLEMLDYRDRTDVEHLADQHIPGGLDLFRHLVTTARRNAERPGIVQTFAVLSADSVTDDHPAKEYFRGRYTQLRSDIREALHEVCDPDDPPDDAMVDAAAAAVLAVMDGLQVQWLLDPEAVDLAYASAFAIEAVLTAAVGGRRRRRMLEY
ncbi:TetR/AcrR family transcriptional regulator [Actinotalea sp. M2MS4P-6]|uniref:TetR/AcrR family transcriptional regulator n=1 Tax=Actinotalea sp. M2MS4P-6 TaxID=2983762 RepID=UPI0021E443FB|nr:TetR/AcrR family transcriptional regulator [Actinotalea sp. M2MS4P-6]MCV2393528.1 TetR/AcrR family transcriptional regulator [Actinotalea sp. M2MS4P-6]